MKYLCLIHDDATTMAKMPKAESDADPSIGPYYPPRLPDLPEVDCGLIFGGGGGAFAGFIGSPFTGLLTPRFDEKSGMPRGDFLFIGRSG